MVEPRSLVRLSVKKAAYADLSRTACRKSGAVLGRDESQEQSRKGRLKISQDGSPGHPASSSESNKPRTGVLGNSQPSLRDWTQFSGPTQD